MDVSVRVSRAAEAEIDAIVDYVAIRSGKTFAERLDGRLTAAIDGLHRMPRRHSRLRALLGRRYEYRRVLAGRHRVIFTVNEEGSRVDVVRVDLQSADPASLDDLP